MATVTFDKAQRWYPGNDAPTVPGLDLEIGDGEFMVLVGPSGCGKSTSLRMLAGLEEINGGRILIGDRDVTHVPPKDRDIAMVFQNYALYPHMSVADNMAFALKMAKVPAEEREKRVAEAAKILGLTEFLERKPKALSGGQRQRVAIARAMVLKPEFVMLDEPTSALDMSVQAQVVELLRDLQARHNLAYLFISHDLKVVRALANDIIVMRGGRVVEKGSAKDIIERPGEAYTRALMAAAFNLEAVGSEAIGQ